MKEVRRTRAAEYKGRRFRTSRLLQQQWQRWTTRSECFFRMLAT
jgi:hypothetical protein